MSIIMWVGIKLYNTINISNNQSPGTNQEAKSVAQDENPYS